MYSELFDINENLYFTINDKYVRAISSICNYRKNKENGGDLKILNHIIGRCFLYLKGLEMPDKLTTVTETPTGPRCCQAQMCEAPGFSPARRPASSHLLS